VHLTPPEPCKDGPITLQASGLPPNSNIEIWLTAATGGKSGNPDPTGPGQVKLGESLTDSNGNLSFTTVLNRAITAGVGSGTSNVFEFKFVYPKVGSRTPIRDGLANFGCYPYP
jgi:hypothetical protein